MKTGVKHGRNAFCFQEVPTLKDIFKVGDGIPCRIMSAEHKGNKRHVEVSAKPSDINRDLPVSALKTGCVSTAGIGPTVISLAVRVLLVSVLQLTAWLCEYCLCQSHS